MKDLTSQYGGVPAVPRHRQGLARPPVPGLSLTGCFSVGSMGAVSSPRCPRCRNEYFYYPSWGLQRGDLTLTADGYSNHYYGHCMNIYEGMILRINTVIDV